MIVREANGSRQRGLSVRGWTDSPVKPNSRKQRQSSAEKYELLGKEATQVWATQTDVKQIVWHRNRFQISL